MLHRLKAFGIESVTTRMEFVRSGLTVEINELNTSIPPLEAKISELTNISKGFSSFKSSDDEYLSKLR